MLARNRVLPGHDLVEPPGLHCREGGRELVNPEVEPLDRVIRLPVVAERARELDQVGVARDERAALAGRDRLGRVERVGAGVAVGSRALPAPGGAMRVRAVLQQEDALRPAQLGDALGVERDVSADVHQDRRARPVLHDPALEVLERHAEVLAVAVDELHAPARLQHRQRGGHEGVGRAEDVLALDLRVAERRERAAGPAAERNGGEAVVGAPGLLEGGGEPALGPLVRVDDRIPQLVQARAVALVEPDRELREVGRAVAGPGPLSALECR